jgi:hypothetical protein
VRYLIEAEVDGEVLGGADGRESLVRGVGLDVRHHLAPHRVLVARRRRENCRISRGGSGFRASWHGKRVGGRGGGGGCAAPDLGRRP